MKGQVKFGCRVFLAANEPFQKIIQKAKLCEKYGFDSVFIDDHMLYGTAEAAAPEPFTTLAALAVNTRRIRVGIAVTDLVRRHPAIVAQTLATLSREFPRRIFLGLGAGDRMNQAPFGMSTDHRYGMLKEGLEVIRLLWNSSIKNQQDFDGIFFDLDNAYLQAGQEQPPLPPIYLAATGTKMLRLAGEAANGWLPHCHTPATYVADWKAIQESAFKTKRDVRSFHPAYYTLASISQRRQEADKNILGPAKYFLALNPEALRKVNPAFDHPGRIWEDVPNPKAQRDIIRKIAADIPEPDAYNTVIHGTAADCIEQIERYQNAGCKELMLTFVPQGGLWSTGNLISQIRFFSHNVLRKI